MRWAAKPALRLKRRRSPRLPAADPTPGLIGALHLPRDLSPWSMFASADIIVQSVIVGLAFASVVTWTVWLAKSIELFFARRSVRIALAAIGEERSLAAAADRVGTRTRHRRLVHGGGRA